MVMVWGTIFFKVYVSRVSFSLLQELVRVHEVLEVRESKMVQMSKESIELLEENQTLQK